MRLNNRRPAFLVRARIARLLVLLPLALASCSRPKPAQPQTSSAAAPSTQQPAVAAISTPVADAPSAQAAAAIAIQPTLLTADVPADAHKLDAMLQQGHSTAVTTLAFSPDGKWLASSGYDQVIILWDAATGAELRRLSGHEAAVLRVMFSPDGGRLLSADMNGGIKEWNVNTGAVVCSFKLRIMSRSIAYSADGKKFVIGVDGGEEGSNSWIEIRSAESGKLLRTLKTEWGGFTTMTVTKDDVILASGGQGADDDTPDLYTRTWNMTSGAQTHEVHAGGDAICPDGRLVANLDYGTGKIALMEVSTGKKLWETNVDGALSMVMSPDGQKLAVAVTGTSAMKILSMANGQIIREFPAGAQTEPDSLQAIAFSNDMKFVASEPYEGRVIKIWDANDGHTLREIAPQPIVTGIAASPDGRWIAAGSERGLTLWDVATRKPIKTLWNGSVNQILFSADGRWLAANAGSRFPGETLKVWDTRNWAIVGDFSFPQKGTPVHSFAVVPNDSPLKTLGPLSRSFEFTVDGERHTIWSAPSPVSASPDGKVLAAQFGIGGDVDLWDLRSGQKIRTISAHKLSVFTLSFSGDGKWLLTGGQETPVRFVSAGQMAPIETRVKVWDSATWSEHTSLAFNRVGAGTASLSPDSKLLIVEKDWNLVELFDIVSGASLGTFTAADPRAQARQFSSGNLLITPDGETLMQAAQNGVRMWKLPGAQEATRPGN